MTSGVVAMKKIVSGAAFTAAVVLSASSASAEVAFREDFESPGAASAWTPCDGFSIVPDVGVNGSRGLVWEQSTWHNC